MKGIKDAFVRLSAALLLAAGIAVTAAGAEEAGKPLPTLLIKGEVVSLDKTDPAAILLKVRDRYGFETPIFVGSAAKVEDSSSVEQLSEGTNVEVEYNFDVNTAKRYAVSIKVAVGKAAAETAPAVIETPPVATLETPAPPMSEAAPAPVDAPAAVPETPAPAPGEAMPQVEAPTDATPPAAQ